MVGAGHRRARGQTRWRAGRLFVRSERIINLREEGRRQFGRNPGRGLLAGARDRFGAAASCRPIYGALLSQDCSCAFALCVGSLWPYLVDCHGESGLQKAGWVPVEVLAFRSWFGGGQSKLLPGAVAGEWHKENGREGRDGIPLGDVVACGGGGARRLDSRRMGPEGRAD
jgi:hypothetical protein